jgi:alkylhydroperoxidase family enzyme
LPEDWKALKSGNHSRFSEGEQAALRYGEKMTRTPTSDASIEADALRRYFSDEQIVDIAVTVGLANLTNRITDGLGLELDIPEEKI